MEIKNNSAYVIGLIVLVSVLFGWLLRGNFSFEREGRSGSMCEMMGNMQNNGDDDDAVGGGMMSGAMSQMTMGLQGKTGDDFDKAFISEMVMHHQGAVKMADLALKQAKHQEIKDLAKDIISAQTSEIEKMNSWQASWYGNKN